MKDERKSASYFTLHPSAFILLRSAVAFRAARARGARRRARARGRRSVRARGSLRRGALRARARRGEALRLLLTAADGTRAGRRLARRAALAREVDADETLELVQEHRHDDRLRRARELFDDALADRRELVRETVVSLRLLEALDEPRPLRLLLLLLFGRGLRRVCVGREPARLLRRRSAVAAAV